MDSLLTVVVPSQYASAIRAGCATFNGGAGMFTCALTSDGQNISHYISSGFMPKSLVNFLNSVLEVYGLDISVEEPQAAMERLNLTIFEEVQS